jgi:hypothetical protein
MCVLFYRVAVLQAKASFCEPVWRAEAAHLLAAVVPLFCTRRYTAELCTAYKAVDLSCYNDTHALKSITKLLNMITTVFCRIKKEEAQEFVGIICVALAWGQLNKANGDSIVIRSHDCETRTMPNKTLIVCGLTAAWDFF